MSIAIAFAQDNLDLPEINSNKELKMTTDTKERGRAYRQLLSDIGGHETLKGVSMVEVYCDDRMTVIIQDGEVKESESVDGYITSQMARLLDLKVGYYSKEDTGDNDISEMLSHPELAAIRLAVESAKFEKDGHTSQADFDLRNTASTALLNHGLLILPKNVGEALLLQENKVLIASNYSDLLFSDDLKPAHVFEDIDLSMKSHFDINTKDGKIIVAQYDDVFEYNPNAVSRKYSDNNKFVVGTDAITVTSSSQTQAPR